MNIGGHMVFGNLKGGLHGFIVTARGGHVVFVTFKELTFITVKNSKFLRATRAFHHNNLTTTFHVKMYLKFGKTSVKLPNLRAFQPEQ